MLFLFFLPFLLQNIHIFLQSIETFCICCDKSFKFSWTFAFFIGYWSHLFSTKFQRPCIIGIETIIVEKKIGAWKVGGHKAQIIFIFDGDVFLTQREYIRRKAISQNTKKKPVVLLNVKSIFSVSVENSTWLLFNDCSDFILAQRHMDEVSDVWNFQCLFLWHILNLTIFDFIDRSTWKKFLPFYLRRFCFLDFYLPLCFPFGQHFPQKNVVHFT